MAEISLPESLQTIGEDAFWGTGLTGVWDEESIEALSVKYGYVPPKLTEVPEELVRHGENDRAEAEGPQQARLPLSRICAS